MAITYDEVLHQQRMDELEKKKQELVAAEVDSKAQVKLLEKKRKEVLKEEERLKREVVSLKAKLDKALHEIDQKEASLNQAYNERISKLSQREKAVAVSESEVEENRKRAHEQKNVATDRLNEVKRRESLLDEKQAVVDFNLNILSQLKSFDG